MAMGVANLGIGQSGMAIQRVGAMPTLFISKEVVGGCVRAEFDGHGNVKCAMLALYKVNYHYLEERLAL